MLPSPMAHDHLRLCVQKTLPAHLHNDLDLSDPGNLMEAAMRLVLWHQADKLQLRQALREDWECFNQWQFTLNQLAPIFEAGSTLDMTTYTSLGAAMAVRARKAALILEDTRARRNQVHSPQPLAHVVSSPGPDRAGMRDREPLT